LNGGEVTFSNLFKRGGNKVDFFVLEKKIVERWKWKMGWVWVFFLML
jgi:hypothetical protein